ncbi:MAG: methyltransferase [Bacteroidales bacterium]|nr:acetylserotonin O-methyltransferase [Bacteroidales bacterium]MDD4604020.1 methyltransferase [Bacteroidales bacterium]
MRDPNDQKFPPVWLVKAIQIFRDSLIRLNKKMFPGNVVLYEQFQSFWVLPSLYVAAKLDIATCLKSGPLSSKTIAQRVNANDTNITRILRALCSQGIFKQLKDGRFALNNLAMGLLNESGSLRYMILHHLGPINWNLMSNLEYAVKSGHDAFTNKYGEPIYDYLRHHPDEYSTFDQSMSNLSDLSLTPILNAYNFSKFPVIADIGGGEGFFLANILKRNKSSRGILFDLPEALEKAPTMLEHFGTHQRIDIIPGDFFKEVNFSADLYLLKNIIHNWDDQHCILLLKNISRQIKPDSRLIIFEMMIHDNNLAELVKLLDIQMLATMPGGKERTREEFAFILKESGFELTKIIPTIAPICLIEAKKHE